MAREIRDPDIQILAGISSSLRADYVSDDLQWEGSPFAWIKTKPSRQRGAIGEKLIAGWCAAREFDVTKAPDSECDRLIGGLRVEIKFSTLWKNGRYKFQQLRDQNYEFVICLGVSPFDAHCWAIPKDTAWHHSIPQHGGRRGSDTHWLDVSPNNVEGWLAKYGGTLSQAHTALRRIILKRQ